VSHFLEETVKRLQEENSELRRRIEALGSIVAEVTPELDGMTLIGRIKSLKTKTIQLSKEKLVLSVLARQVRKLLVSSTDSKESEANLDTAKKLLDEELLKK
jgi:predicted RNase H-like nuclease (RuvC/YqgF family)